MENREYTRCYIAFLDMLGFKNLIEQSVCKDVCIVFDNIKKPFSSAHFGEQPLITEDTVKALNIKVMSDSICFYIDAKYANALLALLMSCAIFQMNLLKLSTPVLLRGAVICGDMYAKQDVTFGPGLTLAYLMEEHNAKYPRIIFSNEVLNYARQEDNAFVTQFIESNIIFRDFDAFYTLNYLQILSRTDRNCFRRFRQKIEQTLDTTTDESIREKYLYLERVLKNLGP